jgi:hypothetical protein
MFAALEALPNLKRPNYSIAPVGFYQEFEKYVEYFQYYMVLISVSYQRFRQKPGKIRSGKHE